MQIFPRQMGRTSKLLVILQNSSPPLHSSASSGTRSESHSSYCNCIHQAALSPGCVHIRVPTRLKSGKHVLLFHFCTDHAFQGTPTCAGRLIVLQTPQVGSSPGPLLCPSCLHGKLLQSLGRGPSLTSSVLKCLLLQEAFLKIVRSPDCHHEPPSPI